MIRATCCAWYQMVRESKLLYKVQLLSPYSSREACIDIACKIPSPVSPNIPTRSRTSWSSDQAITLGGISYLETFGNRTSLSSTVIGTPCLSTLIGAVKKGNILSRELEMRRRHWIGQRACNPCSAMTNEYDLFVLDTLWLCKHLTSDRSETSLDIYICMIMRYYYEARIRNYKLVDQAVHQHNQNRKRAALNISRGIKHHIHWGEYDYESREAFQPLCTSPSQPPGKLLASGDPHIS